MARSRTERVAEERLEERRTTPRLDKVFPVYLDGERGPGLGVARNISEGGMFVETREPQPLGSQVRVTFPSREGEMTAVAEVRYVCHLIGRGAGDDARTRAVRGMGVRFLYFEAQGDVPPVVH
jgi:PilZ domain